MRKLEGRWTDKLSMISQVLDSVGTSAIGWLLYAIFNYQMTLPSDYSMMVTLNFLLILLIFPKFKLYSSWRGRSRIHRAFQVLYAWVCVLVAILVALFMLKSSAIFSRKWFFIWGVSAYFYLVIYRALIDQILNFLRKHKFNRKMIVVYGAGAVGKSVQEKLSENYEVGFDILAFVDDNDKIQDTKINGVPVLAPVKLNDLMGECDEIWLALPLRADKKMQEILHDTRHHTCVIRFIPDIFNFRLLNHSVTEIADIPIIEINGTPMSWVDRLVKRVSDFILAAIILLLISPILLTIALAIKLTSRGPILYKQTRHGWSGKPINVYKFRSMYFEKNEVFKQATSADCRITPVGKFLRKTSLDELPQFFNVLQGRMSIVGPRPHAIVMNLEYQDKIDNYMQRHKVRPGITGWAQVNGFRGETDTIEKMQKRIEYDLYYIENWSLFFDYRIILQTIYKGFVNKNAY